MRRLNEAELLAPIEDMVAAIERQLEHEAGQCAAECDQCSQERCTDCERVTLRVFGEPVPVRTAVTTPCAEHTVR